jgi:hypothetical protein
MSARNDNLLGMDAQARSAIVHAGMSSLLSLFWYNMQILALSLCTLSAPLCAVWRLC